MLENVIRFGAVLVFGLFLPLTALSYYKFRKRRNEREVRRVLDMLDVDAEYRKAFEEQYGAHFLLAVGYATSIAFAGLALLFSGQAFTALQILPDVELSNDLSFPRSGSYLIMGIAFLGAYLWGLQFVVRRYAVSDLFPEVYYGLSVRMVVAPALALIIFNAAAALTGEGSGDSGITAMIWPALAFILGAFPHRGILWLSARLPIVGSHSHPSVRQAPLEMIEGITAYDRMRLEELNIDTCYDLANADFVPLVLRTPYSARELLDWILQAKLCVIFGPGVKTLREHGIRTLADLGGLVEEDDQQEWDDALVELAQQTTVTLEALKRAKKSLHSEEMERLMEVSVKLGHYWRDRPSTSSTSPKEGPADEVIPEEVVSDPNAAGALDASVHRAAPEHAGGDGDPSEVERP